MTDDAKTPPLAPEIDSQLFEMDDSMSNRMELKIVV